MKTSNPHSNLFQQRFTLLLALSFSRFFPRTGGLSQFARSGSDFSFAPCYLPTLAFGYEPGHRGLCASLMDIRGRVYSKRRSEAT